MNINVKTAVLVLVVLICLRTGAQNNSEKIKVFLDNDDILHYKTELASTEYIIFRNNKMDSLEINAVSVYKDSSLN